MHAVALTRNAVPTARPCRAPAFLTSSCTSTSSATSASGTWHQCCHCGSRAATRGAGSSRRQQQWRRGLQLQAVTVLKKVVALVANEIVGGVAGSCGSCRGKSQQR